MNDVKLQVTIKDASLCPRYQAVVMELPAKLGAKYLKQMPVNLAKSGMRSIDPVVDSTNDLMLMTGQPLHAFDYDKLVKVGGQESAHIIVRAAKDGEKMTLLDGKEIAMGEGDIVITSNDVPVALAGAMGGANTAIDENTRRIVVESATFNLYNLRGTQFRHGIFSEAITRFTKGQPPALTDFVICKFIAMTEKHYGLKVISDVVDAYPKPAKPSVVKITTEQVNGLLGTAFSFDDVITTLANVGFKVKLAGETLTVTAPWWRTDIHIPEDVVEEVGRLNGYDNIPTQLPQRDSAAPSPDTLGDLKSKIRRILAAAGANEVLTYSFVSEKLLEKAGQDPKNSYKIVNSISPELQYTRQTLSPSLLEKVFQNQDDGYEKFSLFEINRVTQKRYGLNDEAVPVEKNHLAFVMIDGKLKDPYYTAKTYLEKLLGDFGLSLSFAPLDVKSAIASPFEPKRSARVYAAGDQAIAVVGEYKHSISDKFDLPAGAAGFEIDIERIIDLVSNRVSNYAKTSRYPYVKRDLTFQVSANLSYAKLENLLCKSLEREQLWFELVPISIYQGDDQSTKNISWRLTFADYGKTLTGNEVAAILQQIEQIARKELHATIV
ncbi:MAG: phenylalanine--tRNA ligase subunit beta [Candidatus Nomurabacteria bacterium]|jgi:phenylalanyl-tRNA synthetase beta chain|nr:phenylalanine--tRNA ligase subunit beta [Candidatus Nomurabacteria bacterium]